MKKGSGAPISPALQHRLLGYRGRWVVIEADRVLASGVDPKTALAKAQRHGTREPILYRVPEAGASLRFRF